MYYVTFYHADPDADPAKFDLVREAYPRHRAYLDEFAKGGQVWMIGTFGDPATQGSMAIFRSRDAAERFYENDPFHLEGLVHRFELREWNPLEFPDVSVNGGRNCLAGGATTPPIDHYFPPAREVSPAIVS